MTSGRTFASNKVARANESMFGNVIRGKTFARISPHPALQFRLLFRKCNKVNIFHLRCVPVMRIATASSEIAVFMYHCRQFQLSHYVSGLVACGAVYFEQLDRGSRRASAYVTTRAYGSPGYVTTGSFRVVQWSRSRDLSACGRALAPRPSNSGP